MPILDTCTILQTFDYKASIQRIFQKCESFKEVEMEKLAKLRAKLSQILDLENLPECVLRAEAIIPSNGKVPWCHPRRLKDLGRIQDFTRGSSE